MEDNMADGTCVVSVGTSGSDVKCNQPAVATVNNGKAIYRTCAAHARMVEGFAVVTWN